MSNFNISYYIDLICFGDQREEWGEELKFALRNLPFIRTHLKAPESASGNQISIGVIDPQNEITLQTFAKHISRCSLESTISLVLVEGKSSLSDEQVLCLHELGVRDHVKSIEEVVAFCRKFEKELHDQTTITYLQAQTTKVINRKNRRNGIQLLKKVDSMEVGQKTLEIKAKLAEWLGKISIAEKCWKKCLQMNPLNLNAANSLGKLYISNSRVAEGVETLERLSCFHRLNGERFLELGEIYQGCGRLDEARRCYNEGDDLWKGEDGRFKEGKAKIHFLRGEVADAFKALQKRELSWSMISFLNTQAVLAAKEGRHSQALTLYEQAFYGTEADICRAKLKFNMGLSHFRSEQYNQALMCFEESISLGGEMFSRGKRMISKVKALALDGRLGRQSKSCPLDMPHEILDQEKSWVSVEEIRNDLNGKI